LFAFRRSKSDAKALETHSIAQEARVPSASPLGDLGKTLLAVGIALVIAGIFLVSGAKLPFRLGRLPGDIAYQGRNGSFYFPIVTCILLSVALTLIMWIVNLFRR
jgi:hypothetical protein